MSRSFLEVLEALDTQNFKCKQHFSGGNEDLNITAVLLHGTRYGVGGPYHLRGGPAEKQQQGTYIYWIVPFPSTSGK